MVVFPLADSSKASSEFQSGLVCPEPECVSPHATPIEASKFRDGLLSRCLAKLSVSPLEASGALEALRGRNPTRVSRLV